MNSQISLNINTESRPAVDENSTRMQSPQLFWSSNLFYPLHSQPAQKDTNISLEQFTVDIDSKRQKIKTFQSWYYIRKCTHKLQKAKAINNNWFLHNQILEPIPKPYSQISQKPRENIFEWEEKGAAENKSMTIEWLKSYKEFHLKCVSFWWGDYPKAKTQICIFSINFYSWCTKIHSSTT